jgi:hypothetical protein
MNRPSPWIIMISGRNIMIQILFTSLAGRWLRHLGRRRNGGLSGMFPPEIIPL